MVVVEGHRLGMEIVDVRRLDIGVAVAAEVAVALVVGDHEHDVGLRSRSEEGEASCEEEGEDETLHVLDGILDEGGEIASLLWTLCTGDGVAHFGASLFIGGGEFRHLPGMLRRSAIGVDLAGSSW